MLAHLHAWSACLFPPAASACRPLGDAWAAVSEAGGPREAGQRDLQGGGRFRLVMLRDLFQVRPERLELAGRGGAGRADEPRPVDPKVVPVPPLVPAAQQPRDEL